MPTARTKRPRGDHKAPPPARMRGRLVRAGLHQQATVRLRAMIVQGRFHPGHAIVETELCDALGVSRTPLREALKLLAAEGLVELRPNRSPRVVPMLPEETQELFEAVGGIERLAAEFAAVRATPGELRRLRALQARMERYYHSGDVGAYFQFNQKIHRCIVAMSKNSVLKATHDWLLARVERARYFALSRRERWDESVREHREILSAIEARDVGRSGSLMTAHISRTGEVVNDILRELQGMQA